MYVISFNVISTRWIGWWKLYNGVVVCINKINIFHVLFFLLTEKSPWWNPLPTKANNKLSKTTTLKTSNIHHCLMGYLSSRVDSYWTIKIADCAELWGVTRIITEKQPNITREREEGGFTLACRTSLHTFSGNTASYGYRLVKHCGQACG